jgi:hypothetical protein
MAFASATPNFALSASTPGLDCLWARSSVRPQEQSGLFAACIRQEESALQARRDVARHE